MDIGEAFFFKRENQGIPGEARLARREKASDLTRWPNSGRAYQSSPVNQGLFVRICSHLPGSGFFLGLQHLPALVHAGLQIEVMRTAQFAGILVLGVSRLLDRIRRAAHATP